MGAADPAVNAEELDPVGVAAQRLLACSSQPQLESREGRAVSERRRRRQRRAFLGFEEPCHPLAER